MPRHQPKPDTDETGGAMRISGGEMIRRKVECPQTGGVRPMLNRTRMALFNVLQVKLRDALVWDCFAGSGLLGFEALSRGARHCTFVERNGVHARIVQENIDALDLRRRTTLIRGSVFDLVKAGVNRLPNAPADVILLDPPHAMIEKRPGEFWPWLSVLPETGLVGEATVAAIGHPAEMTMPPDIGGWQIQQTRAYGTVAFTILEPKPAARAPS
jgi:16S rRNA (guanine966-N2)-methyltransferase